MEEKKGCKVKKNKKTRIWSEAEVNKFDDYYTLDTSEFTK